MANWLVLITLIILSFWLDSLHFISFIHQSTQVETSTGIPQLKRRAKSKPTQKTSSDSVNFTKSFWFMEFGFISWILKFGIHEYQKAKRLKEDWMNNEVWMKASCNGWKEKANVGNWWAQMNAERRMKVAPAIKLNKMVDSGNQIKLIHQSHFILISVNLIEDIQSNFWIQLMKFKIDWMLDLLQLPELINHFGNIITVIRLILSITKFRFIHSSPVCRSLNIHFIHIRSFFLGWFANSNSSINHLSGLILLVCLPLQ